jgi:Flp pilus assembly protein TadG
MRARRRVPEHLDPRGGERGVATVEAVLVVPLVLVPVLLGVVVFGGLEHTRLVVDAAAAAGARQAAVAGEDGASVRDRIATELRDGGVDPARAIVSVEPAVASWGEPIRVTVSVDAQAAIPFLGTWPVPLRSEFVTRSEVTH